MTAAGLPVEVTREFDRTVEKHTTRLFEDMDTLARTHDLHSGQMRALFAERCGDLGDVYTEWIDEGWDE